MQKLSPFRKIYAKEEIFKETRQRFEQELEQFEQYADYLTVKQGKAQTKSGKARSYASYIVRGIILYEEIFATPFPLLQTREAFCALDQLRQLPNYAEYNRSEARFPNSAINCFDSFTIHLDTLKEHQIDYMIDTYHETSSMIMYESEVIYKASPRPEKVNFSGSEVYPRNISESRLAKERNYWQCEIDSSHRTFTDLKGTLYVEGHHLIPMATQDLFEYTIDFSANIACLCPTCHRQIHFAVPEEKSPLVEMLYDKRRDVYSDYGINMNKDRLMQWYGIF